MVIIYCYDDLSPEEIKRYQERERKEKEIDDAQRKKRLSNHVGFKGGMM